MKQMTFKLKAAFPELEYIFPIINRLTIQGNPVEVSVRRIRNSYSYYLRICLSRCKKYSFVKIKRDLAEVDAETIATLAELTASDILYFEAIDGGKIVRVSIYQSYNALPNIVMPTIPEIDVPELDDLSENLDLNFSFNLRKKFDELEALTKVINILLLKNIYAGMRVKTEEVPSEAGQNSVKQHVATHLEMLFMYNVEDHRASLSISFGVVSSSFVHSEHFASKFNYFFANSEDIHAKFYYYPSVNNRPCMEFRGF